MKKILIIQLTWLLLMSTMLFGATTGVELIQDGGNENGELKSSNRYQGNSQYWHGSFNMLRDYQGDKYLLTGDQRYAHVYQSFVTQIGKEYEVKATLIGADTSRRQDFTGGSIVAIAHSRPITYKTNEIAQSQAVTGGTPTEIRFTFTATSTTSYAVLRGDTSWKYPNLLNLSIKEVLLDDNNQDTTPPTITLNGANPQTLTVGTSYTELGATATDNADGDITASITIDASAVDTTTAGTYTVTYNVNDTAGNTATQVTRTVEVTDETTTPPSTGTNFILGVNLNGAAVTIEGNLWKAEAQALQSGMSFSETPLAYVTSLTPLPTTNSDTSAMLNSVHWTTGDWTTQQTLPNGEYDVYVWIMENYKSNARTIDIEIENTIVVQDIADMPKESWTKYGPFSVNVIDKKLDIKLLRKSGAEAHMMGFAVFGKSITPPTQDSINTISGPVTIKHGESVTLNVDYIASQARDVVAYLKRTTGEDENSTYYYKRVTVQAGGKTQQFTFTVPDDAPTDATYKYGVYIAPVGKYFKDNLGKAYQQNIHVESDVVAEDNVTSISGPATIKHGESVTLNVDYVASQKRDVVVYLKSTTDTKRKSEVYIRREVAAGSETEQFTFTVPANAPTDETYKYGVYIAPIGGYWKDNLGKAYQENVHIESAEINDTTPPVITLNGDVNVTLTVGDTYIDAGANASDTIDGNITANIVTVSNVDTTIAGTYTVTYDVNDTAGNNATQVRRTVEVTEAVVVDTTPPVITLNGDVNVTLTVGDSYEELGATATDKRDGDVSVSINGSVDTTTAGEYILTYTAIDSSGNIVSVTRTVNLKSNELILESLVLSMKQTNFIRKKVPNSDYYTRVREPVTVIGTYSDGHSEDVTDNVKWEGDGYKKVIKVTSNYLVTRTGEATLIASIGDIKSNTLNIDVQKEQEERLLTVEIVNKNKRYYKNRDAVIYLDLMYKSTSAVKLRFKLKESDGVRFEDGSMDREIIFSPTDTHFDSHFLRLVDQDVNNTNPYTIITEVFESQDTRYGDQKPKDIVVETSKMELLTPSIEGRRGAIRGVPIKFGVLSEHLHLKYTLIDPPKGMKITENYRPHNAGGGTPRIGGVNVEWNVPMDIEEKIYTITMKATDLVGNTAQVSFDIKVPQTKVISTKVVNNELIVTDKSSSLYGMKMKGHDGEDISNLKLRSVAYADVWKKKIKNKKPEDTVKRIVLILDNMPEKLDVKMPEYMDTFKERINIGMHSYKYNERLHDKAMSFDPWDSVYGEIYLYENTNGYVFFHRDTEYEGHGSKAFLIILDKSQKIGK